MIGGAGSDVGIADALMMVSCASQMQAEEEKMGGEMLGEAVSHFIWAEVSPF